MPPRSSKYGSCICSACVKSRVLSDLRKMNEGEVDIGETLYNCFNISFLESRAADSGRNSDEELLKEMKEDIETATQAIIKELKGRNR